MRRQPLRIRSVAAVTSLTCAALTCALSLDAKAQGLPEISPVLKSMLAGLPIAQAKGEVQKLVGTLKKTTCGGGLTGCYMTKSGPLQLYFFTSNGAQQTFLLVLNQKMALPTLLKDNVQKMLGGTSLQDPIISISTMDLDLDTIRMPPDLQNIVRDSYFNINSLSFSSGVQLMARADLGGLMKANLLRLGVKADQLMMRAGVVMPIPADLTSAAGTGAGLAGALKDGQKMTDATADAAKPSAYVEFQMAPNSLISMGLPRISLTDATFFLDNSLVFGYKGNARFDGTDKAVILHFQTPLGPEGAMDLLDFSFRMAMPQTFTLEDHARMSMAMAVADDPSSEGARAQAAAAALQKYGGGYIGNIKAIVKPLLAVTKPLSVFQIVNPVPAPPYKFGDRTKPFPTTDAPFNVYLLGPLADGGPKMHVAGNVRILGQTMGKMDVTVGTAGFKGLVEEKIMVKLGPLGRVGIKMLAQAEITSAVQTVRLDGQLADQKLELVLNGDTMSVYFSASCLNPFEIRTSVKINPSLNIADILEGQGGVNVDPSKINKCIGKELEAAYNKIANEYKTLSGYTASAATAALNKLSSDALAALNADANYKKAKDAARNTASTVQNDATRAFNAAFNAFKGIGKKKRHPKPPDLRFAASVFDWDYYYDTNADVVKAKVDLATHWRDYGFAKGRQGSPEFSAKYYRSRYYDVQALCSTNDYLCVVQHWHDYGLPAGRQGSPTVAVASYLKRYPDLQNAFGKEGYTDALEHWMNNGADEHRNPAPEIVTNGPINGPHLAGGEGGDPWTDIDQCAGGYVTGFKLRYGGSIDAVQFRYSTGWGKAHGNSSSFTTQIMLQAGDYIVRVDYRSAGRVDGVTFKSKLGKTYGPYGYSGGTPRTWTAIPGEKLGCMSGRAGSSIDRMLFTSTGSLR